MEELFNLVDIDGSGIMEWSEFETFVANEIQEGRSFLEGEFVLPSGAGIQFAAMVDVLRRKARLQAIMKACHMHVSTACLLLHKQQLHCCLQQSNIALQGILSSSLSCNQASDVIGAAQTFKISLFFSTATLMHVQCVS